MTEAWQVLVLALILFGLLAAGVWIALALFVTALVSLTVFSGVEPVAILGTIAWNATNSWALVSLPLFVLMGEILARTRLSERLFQGLTPWLAPLPGGLLHVNVAASTLFAAVSGSSAATAATIGKITIPELGARGYDLRLVVGSLGGAGTLGFLIPPSLIMIVYGILAEVSIGQLFLAGIVPGLLLAAAFMLYLAGVALWRPDLAPAAPRRYSWVERGKALLALAPTLALVAAVLGSIYAGLATPTESAAIGVVGALAIAGASRSLDRRRLKDALLGAVRTTSMIGLIIAGASLLSTAIGFLGVARALADWIATLGLSPLVLVLALMALYVLLGMFLDGISMIVVTLPVTLPLVKAAGFDPIWFGIFLVLMVEAAQITPPLGFNLFVLQSQVQRPIGFVARATLPFFFLILGLAVLLALFPQLAHVLAT